MCFTLFFVFQSKYLLLIVIILVDLASAYSEMTPRLTSQRADNLNTGWKWNVLHVYEFHKFKSYSIPLLQGAAGGIGSRDPAPLPAGWPGFDPSPEAAHSHKPGQDEGVVRHYPTRRAAQSSLSICRNSNRLSS